jgi:hypothetical protein
VDRAVCTPGALDAGDRRHANNHPYNVQWQPGHETCVPAHPILGSPMFPNKKRLYQRSSKKTKFNPFKKKK